MRDQQMGGMDGGGGGRGEDEEGVDGGEGKKGVNVRRAVVGRGPPLPSALCPRSECGMEVGMDGWMERGRANTTLLERARTKKKKRKGGLGTLGGCVPMWARRAKAEKERNGVGAGMEMQWQSRKVMVMGGWTQCHQRDDGR
jgi:hypothetical protein